MASYSKVKDEEENRNLPSSDSVNFQNLDTDGKGGLNVFELHTALLNNYTLVPIESVYRIFSLADKNADGNLSLEEFKVYLSHYDKLDKGSAVEKRIEIWITLLTDWKFWTKNLQALGGVCLLIMFFAPVSKAQFEKLALLKTLTYFCGTAYYTCTYPFFIWQSQVSFLGAVRKFRQACLKNAIKHIEDEGAMLLSAMDTTSIYRTYTDDVMFPDMETAAKGFTRRQLQIKMLEELGDDVSPALFDQIWADDLEGAGYISAEEALEFLLMDLESPSLLKAAFYITLGTVTSPTWISSVIFLVACVADFKIDYFDLSSNISVTFPDFTGKNILNKNILFAIGSLYFIFIAYDVCRESYALQQTSKKMIQAWLYKVTNPKTEKYMDEQSKILSEKFESNCGLSKSDLYTLLESNAIFLPMIEFDKLFAGIDQSNNGEVSKDELSKCVENIRGATIPNVLSYALKDWNFLAQTSWIFGGLFFFFGEFGDYFTPDTGFRVSEIDLMIFFVVASIVLVLSSLSIITENRCFVLFLSFLGCS